MAVLLHDADAGALRLVGQVWEAGEDTGEIVVGEWLVALEGTICGRVFRTGAAALSADVALDPDDPSFPGGRARSSLTLPIASGDDIVGVINLEAPWLSAFSIADYERLTALAATAIEHMPVPDDDFEEDPTAA